jgi:hypothetical protein
MLIKRHCEHAETVPVPETKEEFLMERGRRCKKCRAIRNPESREAVGPDGKKRNSVPRPMAMAMDTHGE